MACNGSAHYILPPPENESLILGFLGFAAGRWSAKSPVEQLFLCIYVSSISVYLLSTASFLEVFRAMQRGGEVVPGSTVCLLIGYVGLVIAGSEFVLAEVFLHLTGSHFVCQHEKATVLAGLTLKIAAFALDFVQYLLLCFCAERITAVRDPIRYLHSDKRRRLAMIISGSVLAAALSVLPNLGMVLGCPLTSSRRRLHHNLPNSWTNITLWSPWSNSSIAHESSAYFPKPFWSLAWSRCLIFVSPGVALHNAVLLFCTLGQVLLSFWLLRLLRKQRQAQQSKVAWPKEQKTPGKDGREPQLSGNKRKTAKARRVSRANRAARDSRAGALVVLCQSWLSGAVGLTVAIVYVLQQAKYVSGLGTAVVLTLACVALCALTPLLVLLSSRSFRRYLGQWRWHARLSPRRRLLKVLALWYLAGPVFGIALWLALGVISG